MSVAAAARWRRVSRTAGAAQVSGHRISLIVARWPASTVTFPLLIDELVEEALPNLHAASVLHADGLSVGSGIVSQQFDHMFSVLEQLEHLVFEHMEAEQPHRKNTAARPAELDHHHPREPHRMSSSAVAALLRGDAPVEPTLPASPCAYSAHGCSDVARIPSRSALTPCPPSCSPSVPRAKSRCGWFWVSIWAQSADRLQARCRSQLAVCPQVQAGESAISKLAARVAP